MSRVDKFMIGSLYLFIAVMFGFLFYGMHEYFQWEKKFNHYLIKCQYEGGTLDSCLKTRQHQQIKEYLDNYED